MIRLTLKLFLLWGAHLLMFGWFNESGEASTVTFTWTLSYRMTPGNAVISDISKEEFRLNSYRLGLSYGPLGGLGELGAGAAYIGRFENLSGGEIDLNYHRLFPVIASPRLSIYPEVRFGLAWMELGAAVFGRGLVGLAYHYSGESYLALQAGWSKYQPLKFVDPDPYLQMNLGGYEIRVVLSLTGSFYSK